MTLTIKHATLSNVLDEGVPGEIGPSEWNEGHTITQASGKMLCRTAGDVGPTEEKTIAEFLDNQLGDAPNRFLGRNTKEWTAQAGDPIVILATGQSNFTRTPALTWTPADNCFVWNWDGVDGHVGTAFIAVDPTVMNVARKFASDVARVNATRNVYLINISFSGQDISHWQSGAPSPDVFQNILDNITPALAAIGRTEIDVLLWWQGESQTSNPDNYVTDWQTVHGRFTAQSWFPRATPVMLFGLAPTTISGSVRTDITNAYLQMIGRNDLDMRTFVYPGTFGASQWEDTFHMTAEGYNRAGRMASNEFVYGPGRNILIDPVTGYIRSNVIGRPAFRNLVIGGDLTTNPWQRGTTFTAIATTQYGPDRFNYAAAGAGVVDWLKTADAPTIAQAGMFTQHCLHVDVTTADTSIAATDVYLVQHRIEGLNASFLGFGQTNARRVTVSFWVKSTKTGIFYCGIRNSAGNRSYFASYTVSASDTWEFKTVTVPGDTSGTWLYTNGAGMYVFWSLAAGSNFQGTANTWNSSNLVAASDQVNALDSASNNFKLALVQVEEGIGASPFEQLPASIVLERCQRYARKSFDLATAPAQNVGSVVGATFGVSHVASAVFGTRVQFDQRMRATPTITTYNPSAANANWRDTTNGADRTVTVADQAESGFTLTGAAGAAAASNYIHWLATAEL